MASGADHPQPQHRFFKSRTIVLPTWRIGVPAVLFLAILCGVFVKGIYPWLAVTDPLPKAPYLIVEGWMPDYALKSAAERISADHVTLALCTGVPIERGTLVSSYGNYANYAEATLATMGASPEKIAAVPADLSRTERTRMMARAVESKLTALEIPDGRKRINVITVGTHARRSRQIYQEELGKAWQVGVVSIPDQETDPDRWFLQSTGVKNVINESIALTLGLFGVN
jgi:hypothetical protein